MQGQEFKDEYLMRLNEQQRVAVQSVDGAILLLAVPGSGKTTVLIIRLGYMIYRKKIDPKKILTITYTVAAKDDMSKRFASYFGEESAKQMEFRTINGICAQIIRHCGKKMGKDPFKLVEKKADDMLAQICRKAEGGYVTESDLNNVRTLISYIKNMMLNEKEIGQLEDKEGIKISKIYEEYCNQLKEQKMMDYDDQMVYAYQILNKRPDVLGYFQDKYPYICVDEAQDTSKIQHAIIRLLASKTENLFMVGDEDQSIYGFRAAYPEALLQFEKNYPDGKTLLMEENFRSDGNIVIAADKFIQKNTLRHEKHMKPTRTADKKVKEVTLKDRNGQYAYLAKVADGCTSKTAVLYRNNENIIPLVDLLERKKIPYQMKGKELAFFTHRTIVDIVNIIGFAMDQKDTELFRKIYFKLEMYLTREEAEKIIDISKKKNIGVLEAAVKYGNLEIDKVNKVNLRTRQFEKLLTDSPEKAVASIVSSMGYQQYMKRNNICDSKIELLKTIASREDSAKRLIERLIELKDIIEYKEQDYDCLFVLSTIHASKGLEYDTVYLMDAVDGILPEKIPKNLKNASKEEIETYEEERRLFYVGVTRAENQLVVFTIEGRLGSFVAELLGRTALKEKESRKNIRSLGVKPDSKQNSFYNNLNPYKTKKVSNEKYQEFIDELKVGVTVKHEKFGEGLVMDVDEKNVQIQFGAKRMKIQLKMVAANGILEVVK